MKACELNQRRPSAAPIAPCVAQVPEEIVYHGQLHCHDGRDKIVAFHPAVQIGQCCPEAPSGKQNCHFVSIDYATRMHPFHEELWRELFRREVGDSEVGSIGSLSATFFRAPGLRDKFLRLWPFLLPLDEIWALSPFLLLHHINFGLALSCTALLVHAPFAQRSLVLMGAAMDTAIPVTGQP